MLKGGPNDHQTLHELDVDQLQLVLPSLLRMVFCPNSLPNPALICNRNAVMSSLLHVERSNVLLSYMSCNFEAIADELNGEISHDTASNIGGTFFI